MEYNFKLPFKGYRNSTSVIEMLTVCGKIRPLFVTYCAPTVPLAKRGRERLIFGMA
jgi:hypothetical protein